MFRHFLKHKKSYFSSFKMSSTLNHFRSREPSTNDDTSCDKFFLLLGSITHPAVLPEWGSSLEMDNLKLKMSLSIHIPLKLKKENNMRTKTLKNVES